MATAAGTAAVFPATTKQQAFKDILRTDGSLIVDVFPSDVATTRSIRKPKSRSNSSKHETRISTMEIQHGHLTASETGPKKVTTEQQWTTGRTFVTSPYTTSDHLLDLQTLDTPSRLVTLALAYMTPTTLGFRTEPYAESFNWDIVISKLRELSAEDGYEWKRETKFYAVLFRSKLKGDADVELLGLLDERSHAEAMEEERGGLLKYWFGVRDESERNLATCIWRSREDAVKGGSGPWHRKARNAAGKLYERIDFWTGWFVIEEGASGWRFDEMEK